MRIYRPLVPLLESAWWRLIGALWERLLRWMTRADTPPGWMKVGVWVVWRWRLSRHLTLTQIRRWVVRVVGLIAIGHASRGRGIVWHPRGVSRAAICWAVWQAWLQWGGIGMTAFEDDLDLRKYVGYVSNNKAGTSHAQ